MYWGHVAIKITRVDFLKVRPKVTGSKNSKWPPGTREKFMIDHNFQRKAPRRFILVSTPRFLGMRNSNKIITKNLKAIQCTEIQDSRHASMKNLCLLLPCFFKCPYTIHSGVYTYVFMYEEFKKSKSKALTQANVQKSKMAATLTWKIYV